MSDEAPRAPLSVIAIVSGYGWHVQAPNGTCWPLAVWGLTSADNVVAGMTDELGNVSALSAGYTLHPAH